MNPILSANTQTQINQIIDYCVSQGISCIQLADQLTKEQLVKYIDQIKLSVSETLVAKRSLSKGLVVFLKELNDYGSAHYQTIKDNIKIKYNHVVNDYSSLRYWNLIMKSKETGWWKITEDGKQFLVNNLQLNEKIDVQNNKVIKRYGNIITVTHFGDLEEKSFKGKKRSRKNNVDN